MKTRQRSDMRGWRPKEKFTCGLNVTQEEWDRIFKVKLEKEKKIEHQSTASVYQSGGVAQSGRAAGR